MSRMTNTEKYIIQGMLKEGKKVSQIAKAIDKPVKDVEKYIEKLDSTIDDIVKIKTKKLESEDNRTDEEHIIINNTKRKFISAGLTEKDAENVIQSALAVLDKNKTKVEDENEFYGLCLSRMKAGHFINKKTQGGREGVAIMNGAVSAKLDESRRSSNFSKRNDGCLYDIRKNKILKSDE